MSEIFLKYRRTNIAVMRPVLDTDTLKSLDARNISVSNEDEKNGSPKHGDMIARNPTNPHDQWLVAQKYFEENFELIGD